MSMPSLFLSGFLVSLQAPFGLPLSLCTHCCLRFRSFQIHHTDDHNSSRGHVRKYAWLNNQ